MNTNLDNKVVHRFFSTIETDGLIKSNNGKIASEVSWFTPWSFAHLVGGVLLRGMGSSLLTTFIFHTLYEMVNIYDENLKKKWRNEGYPWFYGDSIQNSIGDTICTIIGWIIFDKVIDFGRTPTLIFTATFLVFGYLFLSSYTQGIISKTRSKYMDEAYNLKKPNYKLRTGSHINFLGDKLPMPYALGLFIGLGLFILYATGAYYPKIVA